MKTARSFSLVLLLMFLGPIACAFLTPTAVAPPVEANPTAQPSAAPATALPTSLATAAALASPTAAAPSATPVAVASPSPTTAPRALEIVQSQAWTDRLGHVRVNVLLRNPYDFPAAPGFGARASALNGAGEFIRDAGLYFLDGISGGNGFLLPGETIAANACFTCETTPLSEAWGSVEIVAGFEDATDRWQYSTEVEASLGEVSFEGDSPIFWASGTVTNHSAAALDRISVRVFVFDEAGQLVGAAEASAWEVAPGAAANFNGYGFGQAAAGPVEYEVTALGVNY